MRKGEPRGGPYPVDVTLRSGGARQGRDYAGGSNVIEALVKSLRRKLGNRSEAIQTVRGLGYRFVAAV